MRGVKFGDFHTVDDWGLILNAKTINPPTPKTVKVSVDGRDGDFNISRALTGEIKFNNREASFTFLVTEGTIEDRSELLTIITNAIHGNELQIIEPDKPEYYLFGECSVSEVNNSRAYGSFKVSADCDPYYYSLNEVNRVVTLSTTATEVTITNNGRKRLVPTITVGGSVTIGIGDKSISLSQGTYKTTDVVLFPGATRVTLSGSGNVTFTYREAVL